ncbi:GTP-binding protein, partial [archaeon]
APEPASTPRSDADKTAPAPEPDVKCVLCGDAAVGKTWLFLRWLNKPVTGDVEATIGASFAKKSVPAANGTRHTLALWDTAGQERYRSMLAMYARGAAAVLFLFDITQRASFYGVESDWLPRIRATAAHMPKCALFLVGTKCDMRDLRTVSSEEARAFAEANGMVYREVSAKSEEGVQTLLTDIGTQTAQSGSARCVLRAACCYMHACIHIV